MEDNKAATLAKARRELEDLYLGIPDESVNLTFKDFAQIKPPPPPPQPTTTILELIPEISSSSSANKHDSTTTSSLHKLPSLDFSKVLRESNQNQPHHNRHYDGGLNQDHRNHHHHEDHRGGRRAISPEKREEFRRAVERSMAYDDASVMSMSMASGYPRDQNKAQRRRPGIPHTNICTICTTYIYIFRHRCLVCGRVYCRDCVDLGMGEMIEGRKCIHCLGRRFSQRYIKRAGNVGCCSRYPSTVKQAELRWAEKGPRRSGERAYGGSSGRSSVMMSRTRSPLSVQGTSTMAHASGYNTPNSFVSASHYSPYNISSHHLPI
ncbi:hypothetical protein Dsin_028051 [Dipteronia sinensis]|uniref:Uncharacterized protein n=1 Tax=Dipteronia sinensis TaxID=43782 RepID=A0AAD9ZPU7_9ROSI|nr:hypothetical protein Dsin_028051 [Dipteronia sinensis]